MAIICVQPVAIRSALLWVICSFWMRDSARSGCHAGWLCVGVGLMYCLYTRVMSSLDCPNVVLVSALRTLKRVLALVLMLFVSGLNLILLSYVTPNVVAVVV